VANKTVGFVNGEMQSLNELGMARGAPKVYPSSQLTQMPSMGKAYILKYHIPFQVVFFVTSILQTITIINFIMEFLDASPNNDISQCKLEIFPFPFQMIPNAWFAVTTQANHFVMRGGFPRVDIFLHIVTEATK